MTPLFTGRGGGIFGANLAPTTLPAEDGHPTPADACGGGRKERAGQSGRKTGTASKLKRKDREDDDLVFGFGDALSALLLVHLSGIRD